MTHKKTFQWNERIGRAHGIGNQCVKCTGWLVIAFIFPHFWYGWRRGPKSLRSHFKANTFKSGPDGIEILANFVNKSREQERKTVCMFLANWATSEIAEGDWKFIQSLGRRVCNISEDPHTSAPVCVCAYSINHVFHKWYCNKREAPNFPCVCTFSEKTNTSSTRWCNSQAKRRQAEKPNRKRDDRARSALMTQSRVIFQQLSWWSELIRLAHLALRSHSPARLLGWIQLCKSFFSVVFAAPLE